MVSRDKGKRHFVLFGSLIPQVRCTDLLGESSDESAHPWIVYHAWRLRLYDALHKLDAANSHAGRCVIHPPQYVRLDGSHILPGWGLAGMVDAIMGKHVSEHDLSKCKT
jgi:hypothetical protein